MKTFDLSTQIRNLYPSMADISTQASSLLFNNSSVEPSTVVKNYAYFSAEADIFPLLVALLIIMTNGWVILLVFKHKILRTITNYILCSLAFSDLLTGLLSIPLFVTCNIVRTAAPCLTSDVLLKFTSISTVAHLLAVTMDRYLAIMRSLRYSSIMTKGRAFFSLGFIWTTSAILSLIHFSWTNPTTHDVKSKPTQTELDNEVRYDVFCLIAYFIVPLLFMIYAYGHIFYQVVRQRKIMTQNNQPGYPGDKRPIDKHKWKAALIFLVMLLVYVVCWLPYFALRLHYNFVDDTVSIAFGVAYLIVYQRFCTSLFNPLLYILGKQDFRKVILSRFERRPQRSFAGTSSLLRTTDV
ncbi:hypothetical protein QZH41_003349 [Actinostola sp. cb2023]|nr:hypothetical protein QZH41_003349 [Actinostola sp. cb2023]